MTISVQKNGYVYAIEGKLGYYKLGKSANVDMRLKQLQTGNDTKLRIVYRLEVKDMSLAERSLHTLFAKDRIEGEWFHIKDTGLFRLIFETTKPITHQENTLLTMLGLR